MTTPTDSQPASVDVTQEDREAVQAFHRAQLDKLMRAVKDRTAGGLLGEDEGDAGNLVQAFARHRLLAEETARVSAAMQGERPPADVDTVEFVRYWMMSSDEPTTAWEREFAASIDARHRLASLAPARCGRPAISEQAGALERAREIAIQYALPGQYDGISTHATRRGDADDRPYMLALVAALSTPPQAALVGEGALPQQIGRLTLGEKRSDGERLCSHCHDVPAGHPLYWPERMGEYPDDMDPLCLAHAIEQAVDDNGWCEKCLAKEATPAPVSRDKVAEADMSLAVALDFADKPRLHGTMQAPADSMAELREALRVIATAYREALALAQGGEVEA